MIYIIPINNNITNIAYKYHIWFISYPNLSVLANMIQKSIETLLHTFHM